MPEIPQLQTNNLDVSNTLFKLAAMKQMQNQQNIENQRALEQDTRQNALFEIQKKQSELAIQKEKGQMAKDGVIQGLASVYAGKPEEWDRNADWIKSTYGIPIEKTASFSLVDKNGNQILDKKALAEYARIVSMNADDFAKYGLSGGKEKENKILYGPNGKTISVAITKGEDYDPEAHFGKGWSFKDPTKDDIAKERNALGWANLGERKKERESGKAKDSIRAYLDPVDNSVKYYNLNSAKDRATIQASGLPRINKEGKKVIHKLIPVSNIGTYDKYVEDNDVEDVPPVTPTLNTQSKQSGTSKRMPGETIKQFLARTKG